MNPTPERPSPQRGFLRSVGVLVGGSAFAHAVTAAALPVLSRLYSPSDFSVLAVFSGLLSIVAVAASLRFDIAITLPEHDADAINILALAILSAVVVSLVLAALVYCAPHQITAWLNQPRLVPYLWLLPLGTLLTASYSALQCWFVRERNFSLIAGSRIGQSVASTGAQLAMGAVSLAPVGLLVGYVLNTGAACLVLGYQLLRGTKRALLNGVSWQGMRAMFSAYDRFPRYSTFEALSNSAAVHVPVIMIAALAVGPEAGYLTLAMAVMQAPMSLIGNAIGQVYLSRAPLEYRAGHLANFTAEVFAGLMKAGVGPLLLAGIVSPSAFAIVFGEDWRRAGQLVAWMTPWFVLQFLAVPISMALHITGNQRTALVLQLSGMLLRVAAVLGAATWSAGRISEAYAVSGFIFYFAYAAVLLRIVGVPPSKLLKSIRDGLTPAAAWVGAGLAISFALTALQLAVR